MCPGLTHTMGSWRSRIPQFGQYAKNFFKRPGVQGAVIGTGLGAGIVTIPTAIDEGESRYYAYLSNQPEGTYTQDQLREFMDRLSLSKYSGMRLPIESINRRINDRNMNAYTKLATQYVNQTPIQISASRPLDSLLEPIDLVNDYNRSGAIVIPETVVDAINSAAQVPAMRYRLDQDLDSRIKYTKEHMIPSPFSGMSRESEKRSVERSTQELKMLKAINDILIMNPRNYIRLK